MKSVKPMQFQVLKLGNNASSKKNVAVELLHFRKTQSMWKVQDPFPLTMESNFKHLDVETIMSSLRLK